MRCLLASASSSASLTHQDLLEAERFLADHAIEVAELRASDKQLAFQDAFFARRDPATGRPLDTFVAMGANRSGKSIVCGWLCFAKYLRDHARNGDWFWTVAQTLDRSIGGVQQELWKALPRWMFSARGKRATHAWRTEAQQWDEKLGFGMHRKIVLPTSDGGQCLVEFRSADQAPATFEQAKLRGVWADERLPEEIFDRLIPRLMDRRGFFLYSDIPEQFWHIERLKEAPPEAGVHYQHLRTYDNEHNLPAGAIARAAALMTADQRRLRIEGEHVVMEGLVYKEWKDATHWVEFFPPPADWPRWRLIDYGSSAPTACAWVTIAPNERKYVYREYYQAGLSVPRNAQAIKDMSAGETYRTTYIDPHAFDPPPAVYGSSDTVAQQYAKVLGPVTPWPYVQVMGEHAMVQTVKQQLEVDMLRVMNNCPACRREFRSWKYVCDKDGKPVARDAFEAANNHLLDCLKGWLGTRPCYTRREVKVTGG